MIILNNEALKLIENAAHDGNINLFMEMFYLLKQQYSSLTINEFISLANISQEDFLKLVQTNESITSNNFFLFSSIVPHVHEHFLSISFISFPSLNLNLRLFKPSIINYNKPKNLVQYEIKGKNKSKILHLNNSKNAC